jgi:hypothetical protein
VGDGWAWVSLSAFSEALSGSSLAERMPGAVPSRTNRNLAAVNFSEQRGMRLHELLEELASYLVLHRDILLALAADAQLQLRIGWSPLSPQECLVIPSGLLSSLADLKADVMLDTYSEESEIEHNGESSDAPAGS